MNTPPCSLTTLFFGVALLSLGAAAVADSTPARCGYSASVEIPPRQFHYCDFSQRQGAITIAIEGQSTLDLTPVGNQPGNFVNAAGQHVYRQRGPAQVDQLFRTPAGYLHVHWLPGGLSCDKRDLTAPSQCVLTWNGISLELSATDQGSLNTLTTIPRGLPNSTGERNTELDGSAHLANVTDLNRDGWPEFYVFVTSAGSGAYGSVSAWGVNEGKSLSPIYLPPLEQTPGASTGYMGHDEFVIVDSRLVRRFPIFAETNSNASRPSTFRQIAYRLMPGEAGWVLEVDKVEQFKDTANPANGPVD
ncbi:MAG: hypothetical protein AAGA91_10550 [Pseudomonadota bacterium]